jgi:membrane protein required for colicin V production
MLIDIIFLVLLVTALIKGFQKGLIVAVFSIIALIVGLAAAIKLSAVVGNYLGEATTISQKWLPFISFAVVFIGVIFLIRLLAKIIESAFEVVLLGWVNKLGGIIFYALGYILIYSVLLFYAEKLQIITPATIQSSITYSFIKPFAPVVINGVGVLIPWFKDMFRELEQFFGNLAG